MAPSEPGGSIRGRPEHPSRDEVEENDLKNSFVKMIEALKEDKRDSPKEIKQKISKNWKKSLSPLNTAKKVKKNNQISEGDSSVLEN